MAHCHWMRLQIVRDGDKSNSAYGVDPGFADAANGDFTPSAPEVFAHGSGDPRWLN